MVSAHPKVAALIRIKNKIVELKTLIEDSLKKYPDIREEVEKLIKEFNDN